MDYIFFILTLLSIVGLILGIISPHKYVFWSKKKTRKSAITGYLTLTIAFFVAFAVAIPHYTDTASKQSDLKTEQVDSHETKKEEPVKEKKADKKNDKKDDQKAKKKENDKKPDNADSKKEHKEVNANNDDRDQELGEMEVHFIDVGQADAALLKYDGDGEDYNILIDTGDWNGNQAVEYLNQEGVDNLDLVVGSHPHADHIGQMDKVIDQVNVEEVWMSGDDTTSQVYDRVLDAIEANDINYEEPRAGDSDDVGPLKIDVLSPHSLTGDLNDDSIVMKATYGDVSFLFTGDAEQGAEQGMLSRNEDLTADILKVGHHGSNTSNTQPFVDAVDPKVAVISVGQDNKYDHPDQEVISRYEDKGADLYATKDNGTIIVSTDGKDYDIETNQNGEVTAPVSDSGDQEESSSESESTKDEQSYTEDNHNGGCVDINSASEEELQQIKHIGPERAGDVVNGRPYNSVDDLDKVKGIAAKRIQDIKDEGIACVN